MSGMRVLQVTGSSAGGVGRHAREVSAHLAAGGDEVLLAGPAEVLAGAEVRTVAVEITDRPRPGDARAVRALRRLAASAEVVHAHGLRAGALAVLALRALPRGRRPGLVVTLHNLPVGGRAVQAVAAVLERIVARGADVVLGVSGDLVERASARGARCAARALVPAPERPPSGAEPAEVRARLGLDPRDRLLVTVARLAPQKGLDLLLDAAGRLDRQDLRWLVAGEGPLRPDLAARVEADGLPVLLPGHREDAPDLLAAADLVVSTARWEGQPLWLQEALRAGAAVVATDAGGTGEVTGEAALLVPPGDAAALATAIRELLADDRRREAFRAAARRRAGELPTAEAVVAQLREIYLSTRPPGPRDRLAGC